jgi:SAM-dependent methyltransferase
LKPAARSGDILGGVGDRRGSFDEVADLYDRARPPYPAELIADLVAAGDLGPGSRVLEVGCGSGQLTVSLAKQGAGVVAVEVGPRLAELARRRTAHFDGVEVVAADFDRWPLPEERFDLVVAAGSFGWLDAATRVGRCADACREGGALAIIEAHFGWGGHDRFSEESAACYARWDPRHDQDLPRTMEDLDHRRPPLEGSRFRTAVGKRYIAAREYGESRYCNLVRTFPEVRALDEASREALVGCLGDLIRTRFDGRIFRHDVYELWLAR